MGRQHLRKIAQREIVVILGLQVMTLAQNVVDLLLGGGGVGSFSHLDQDHTDRARYRLGGAEHLLHRRGERHEDGVVLVLRSGVTDKESAVEALDQLRSDGAVILGTVLNDWKPSKTQTKKSYYYSTFDSYDRT